MPSHQQLSIAALNLQTDEATLVDFGRRTWIQVTERGGYSYVDAHQQYKARYILHLRNRRKLTDEQISFVLSHQRPPYSAGQVDELLEQYRKTALETVLKTSS